ncbi:NTPase [Salmonella enterica]
MSQTAEQQQSGKHPDRAVSTADEDCYGFTHIATELARAIQGIGREGSAVIGIEGAWGTGKTSLLNLLRIALEAQKEDRTYVLSISPWLDGSDTPLVASLLLPVASIIAREEESRLSAVEQADFKEKKALTETARTLMGYTRATARRLAPLAQLAAVVPGIPDTSGGLEALANSDWLKEKEKTTAEMRADIANKIAELDLSFIILLDDLDRLEPAQAVEVIRLVKSVADFPRFRYLLCYDKAVLAEAISQGLGVADGSLYLQKIVQISFGLPRPEAFVLRRQFLEEAIRLYTSVNGRMPGTSVQAALTSVADIYGAALKTPREVRMVINALAFRYAGLRDYVYFPDLCFLQLLRTTNAGLYDWVEAYLSERAVVASGEGHISEQEQEVLTEKLRTHLSPYFPGEAHTVDALSQWVPGISTGVTDQTIHLFRTDSEQEKAILTAGKRLGSQAYWRYYFAFSAPQNVLQPAIFDHIFEVAGHPGKQRELAELLFGYIQRQNLSSRTWFEHILSQLTVPLIASRTPGECRGLLQFFLDYGDEILKRYQTEDPRFELHDLDTYSVADRLIFRLLRDNTDGTRVFLTEQARDGRAWYWMAEYVRHLLWQHGMAGDVSKDDQEEWMAPDTLETFRDALGARLNSAAITDTLPAFPLLNRYIWAWCEISGLDAVREWVTVQSQEDETFLQLLLQLRDHRTRSVQGHYRTLKLASMTDILGDVAQIKARIRCIKKTGQYAEQVALVERAIAGTRGSLRP